MKPVSKNIDGKKRKHENEEQIESSSISGSSIMGEESDASDLQCKCSAKRKSVMRSSSSEEQIGFSTSEEDDEIDKKYTEGQLTERGTGTLHYMDLKNANIFYNEKPDSIEEFMQDIKVDILKNFPEIPDFEESVKKLSSLTRDNLLFSFDLDNILKHLDDGYAHKNYVEVEWMKQIRSDFVRAEQVDKTLDLTDMFDRNWFSAVKDFLISTMSLITTVLNPTEDEESLKKCKELIKQKVREKRKNKGRKLAESAERGRGPLGSVYHHYFTMIGELFFLKQRAVVKRTFIFGDKIVSSVPDLTYGFASRPVAIQKNVLLSVVEVKGKPINNDLSECLEDQLDSGVLGRVGSELFAEVPHSVMFPNSLGIICMETKIIFLYLKIQKEPGELLILPLKNKGIIHYTKPFDILKAQDRGEVCEILYWLGCAQNHCDRELLLTTR